MKRLDMSWARLGVWWMGVGLFACSADPEPGGPSVPPSENLVDEVRDLGVLEQAFRETSLFNFATPDAWLVRLESWSAVSTEPVRTPHLSFFTVLLADDPGSGPWAPGESVCGISGTLTVSTINGLDPFERVRLSTHIDENDCTGTTDVTTEYALEVRQRDAEGQPELLAKWQLLGVDETDPFPGWNWAATGVGANPWFVCPPGRRLTDRDYCAVDCTWDFLTDPSGTDCLE